SRFRAAGGTVLLTTHYMEEAERLCDRVAIMDHGKVIALDTPRALIASLGAEHVVEFALADGTGRPGTAPPPEDLAALPGVRAVGGGAAGARRQRARGGAAEGSPRPRRYRARLGGGAARAPHRARRPRCAAGRSDRIPVRLDPHREPPRAPRGGRGGAARAWP